MKKLALAFVAVLMMAFLMVGCSSKANYTVNDGVIQENGTYTIPVTLEGGSGKASINTPMKIVVKDKTMTATVVWSSKNYDLMIVDGTAYKPTTIAEGATFEVPLASIDRPWAISAQTNAMGTPHLIDYTVTFDPLKLKVA